MSRTVTHVPGRWLFIAGLMLVLCCLPAYAAFRVPKYDGYVTDRADVLSPQAETRLTELAQELDRKTQAQLAVLTVPDLDGTPIEQAALETARQWGVGDRKNTGLLILLALKERQLRAEVGYGLEGSITDGTSGQIQDQFMVPAFRQGNYEAGLLQGATAYAYRIADERGVTLSSLSGQTPTPATPPTAEEDEGSFWPLLLIIFLGLFFLPLLHPRRRRGGFFWGDGPYIGGGFGGFGGGSFGGGGGFGGFGGGGFGGGGSSRGW